MGPDGHNITQALQVLAAWRGRAGTRKAGGGRSWEGDVCREMGHISLGQGRCPFVEEATVSRALSVMWDTGCGRQQERSRRSLAEGFAGKGSSRHGWKEGCWHVEEDWGRGGGRHWGKGLGISAFSSFLQAGPSLSIRAPCPASWVPFLFRARACRMEIIPVPSNLWSCLWFARPFYGLSSYCNDSLRWLLLSPSGDDTPKAQR